MTGLDGPAAAECLCHQVTELLDVEEAALGLILGGEHQATLGASSERARQLDELSFTTGRSLTLVAHDVLSNQVQLNR